MRKSFIIALILAIVPFALLSAGQAVWRLVRAHELARDQLVAAAYTSTGRESNILSAAETLLHSMESQDAVRLGGPACQDALAAAIDGLAYITNMSRVDADGRIVCAAKPVPAAMHDRSGQRWWAQVRERGAFIVSEQHAGMGGRQILTAAIPLKTASGADDGALALGISVDFLAGLMRDRRLPEGAFAALVDKDDKVVASTDAALAQTLFATPPVSDDDRLLRATDADDRLWLIAVAPLAAGDLRLAFAERETTLFAWSYVDVAATIVLPLVMAAAIFLAIWYAANRFVLRWISYLERVARAYGKGHFALKPARAAADAPPEIRTLASAMGEMAENIRQRDASLRQALDQRTMMMREIHHRVKNNLQIVGSLLQIEARRIEEPAARAALKLTQTRINAIALAHRALQEVGAETRVNIARLLGDLAQMLHDAFNAGNDAEGVQVEAPELLVETDIAVPLALLLVEQIGVVSREALTAEKPQLDLRIVAVSDGQALTLTLSYLAKGAAETRRLSSFAEAYLRQLRGHYEARDENGRTTTRFIFPQRTAFAEAQPA